MRPASSVKHVSNKVARERAMSEGKRGEITNANGSREEYDRVGHTGRLGLLQLSQHCMGRQGERREPQEDRDGGTGDNREEGSGGKIDGMNRRVVERDSERVEGGRI